MATAIQHRPKIENALIAVSLFAGLAALLIAWGMGDAEEAARSYQWETAFVGFGLLLAGQWLVGGTPNAKKQQIAATSAALALAGAGLTYHYGLGWGAAAPFVVAYVFLFLAAELCFFLGRDWAIARRTVQYLRFAAVAWNCGWGVYYLAESYMSLPDIVNLYIAFSWLWTASTAIVGWSELCRVNVVTPDRASPPPPTKGLDFSNFSGRGA